MNLRRIPTRTTSHGLLKPVWWGIGVYACLVGGSLPLNAQLQMPDAKQMSGIPRPVTDLPNGAVSVRLIRGDLSHNITNLPVELQVDSEVRTGKTDEGGRAQFSDLPPGARLKAVAVVDGERLESEEFPAPAQGGIRLMLVATDKSKTSSARAGTAMPGQVVVSGRSRIILEPGEEVVGIYYLLDIINNSSAPVEPPVAFTFDMPPGSIRTGLLEGSTSAASVNGQQVSVQGPFAPGRTALNVAGELPVDDATLDLTLRLPTALDQLAVIVKKTGATAIRSPQITNQQDMTAGGETFIAATGGPVAAGQPIVLSLQNLPHHSRAPRWIALSLVGVILAAGIWTFRDAEDQEARMAERKRLLARREKLFAELVRLEQERRSGKVSQARYATRREELIAALEHIYGALDSDDQEPEPSDRGLAA